MQSLGLQLDGGNLALTVGSHGCWSRERNPLGLPLSIPTFLSYPSCSQGRRCLCF